MAVVTRRALEALLLFPSKRCSSLQLLFPLSCRRHICNTPSDSNEQMVEDQLEFARWNNGGGLFHRSSEIDPTAVIEIGAVVHSNSMVGSGVRIGSGTVIGPAVSIGPATKVGYNSVLSNCSVGEFCIIYNGVCVGQDGFGFFVNEDGHMVKKPQELRVRIGNHVEIGANSCVDRGSWRDTIIGDHTKIDNLVQIGHNVIIGRCCMLCGQVGIAGSATLGDYVTLGGRAAVRDHVSIASKLDFQLDLMHLKHDSDCLVLSGHNGRREKDFAIIHVRLAANSCVTKDLTESGDYSGFPAVPIHEWRRQFAKLRRFFDKTNL